MRKLKFILFLSISVLILKSQNNDSTTFTPMYQQGVFYTIKTTIGTTHSGFVVQESKDFIVLENKNTHEKIEINKSQIVVSNSKKQNNKYHEEIFGENEHAGTYMLAHSAFLYDEGATVSNNHWLILQNMDYALTENWAISVTSLLFYPIGVGTKCAFKLNDLNYLGASANVMGNLFSTPGSSSMLWGYSVFGNYTHGTTNKNLSISAGLVSINTDFIGIVAPTQFINIPFVSAAYCNRFSQRFALNSELWIFPQTMVALVGAGLKYVHSERISWTFGCYTNIVSDNNKLKLDLKTIPIPYLGYSRKFN